MLIKTGKYLISGRTCSSPIFAAVGPNHRNV